MPDVLEGVRIDGQTREQASKCRIAVVAHQNAERLFLLLRKGSVDLFPRSYHKPFEAGLLVLESLSVHYLQRLPDHVLYQLILR